jgi:hypothetical protein
MRLSFFVLLFSCQWLYAQNSNIDVESRDWNIIDVDEGEKPSLTLDMNDVPHIVYLDESFSGFIKIAELDGDAFNSTLVAEGYFYGPIDLSFNPVDNTARVGYHDHDEENFGYAVETSSGDFNVEFIESSGHDGWDNTLYIESDGTEHLLSTDTGSGAVEYAFRDSSGDWVVEETGIDQTNYRWATDIVVVDEVVYAVAFEVRSNETRLAIRENDRWTSELITMDGRYPSLDVDENGDVLVAYYKPIDQSSGFVELAHRTNTDWELAIIDTLESFDGGNARNVVKVQRNEGQVYVAYSDATTFKLATQKNDVWEIESVLDVSEESTTLRNMAAMDIDDEGFFHFSTHRAEAGAAGGAIIMYITDKELSSSQGMEQQMVAKTMQLSIQDPSGVEIPNAEITMTSMDGMTTILESSALSYTLEAPTNTLDEIMVCISTTDPAISGVSSTDVIRALRIVLGLVNPCPENLIIADVNEDGTVSSTDLVQMIRVIIGATNVFTGNPSWVFEFNNELKSCETLNFSNLPQSLTIKGYKKGNLECLDEEISLQNTSKKKLAWKH